MNAELTSRLLQTIFFPGSALHDLAVVVKGKRIAAAGVQLPLAEPEDMPDKRLGSRHRAAVGLSRECDALVVVVSEESGKIRLAERGRLTVVESVDQLDRELMSRLNPEKVKAMAAAAGAVVAPEPISNYNPANDATNAFEPINEPLNLDDAGADLDKSRIT
jgi:hypothetical protein